MQSFNLLQVDQSLAYDLYKLFIQCARDVFYPNKHKLAATSIDEICKTLVINHVRIGKLIQTPTVAEQDKVKLATCLHTLHAEVFDFFKVSLSKELDDQKKGEIKSKEEKEDLVKFISAMVDFLIIGANDYTQMQYP